jgi:hypothetical protein
MSLYRLSDPGDLVAPTIVVAFDGWVDAGTAATSALEVLAAGAGTVATFDADSLYDYRSRRPTLVIENGRPESLTWPELTLRRSRHGRRDLLVLSGPEPDYRWHALAEAAVELARRLEVVEWVSLGAIPAAVPHTRPVPVMGTASRPDLLRAAVQVGPEGTLRVPSAALSVLDYAVAGAGLPAVGYFAQIPHYLTGPYPAAAVELLRVLGQHLGFEPPMGTLADEAAQLRTRLDAAMLADEKTRAYVTQLESMIDEERQPAGDDLITEIERFLRERGGDPGSPRS